MTAAVGEDTGALDGTASRVGATGARGGGSGAPAGEREEQEMLRALPFLASLPPALEALVVRLFQPRAFEFGETVFSAGDQPDGMYLVVQGTVRVLVDHDGEEVTLARLGPGEWFGDQARVQSLHRFLRTHAAFEEMSLQAATAMFRLLEPVTVTKGEIVVAEGAPGGSMYFVEDGRLEASR